MGNAAVLKPAEDTSLSALRVAEIATAADAAPVVHFTPTGRRIDQAVVQQFAAGAGAISGTITTP